MSKLRATKPDQLVEAAAQFLAPKYPGLDPIRLNEAICLALAPRPQLPPPAMRLMKPKVAAAKLEVSIKTLRRLADRGLLQRTKLGHRCDRYSEASVLALIGSAGVADQADSATIQGEGAR